jgi:hypothetical protein
LLIRDYFAQESPSFLCLKPDGQQTASWDPVSEDLRACQLTLQLDGQDKAIDITSKIQNQILEYSKESSQKHQNDTAIFMLETSENENKMFHDDAMRLMELIKVRILWNRIRYFADKRQGRYHRGHADRA